MWEKGEKSAPKFIPNSNYHKEEETIKSAKTHYSSNPKPSFNPKRGVKKETSNPREEAFVYMFCGRAGHLDEFYFRHKRIEKRRPDYARNSYRNEFNDFLPHSYSHVPPRYYSRASPRTSSRTLSRFSHGHNHRSYDFSSRENSFVPRHFGYGPHPHRGDRFPRRHGFPARESYTHFEPRHLDGPRFPVVVHVPLIQRVWCKRLWRPPHVAWLSGGFVRFISLTPALSHRPLLVLCRWWMEA
jgi:hypothetical protein